jgi:hypothetical protein
MCYTSGMANSIAQNAPAQTAEQRRLEDAYIRHMIGAQKAAMQLSALKR